MYRIDYKDSRPVYEQIVDTYKRMILIGVMEEDEKMPSVRSLAMELSANPNTIQKAYTELERQGFIYTVKGRGNFVMKNAALRMQRKEEIITDMETLLKEVREMNLDPEEILEEAMRRVR